SHPAAIVGAGRLARPANQGSRGAARLSGSQSRVWRRAQRRRATPGLLSTCDRRRLGRGLRMHPESLPRLKAPRDDGAVLAYPPLDEVGALLADNARRLTSADISIAGRSLRDLRGLVRREAISLAREYLNETGSPFPNFPGEKLLLAGHQPELFHPGVWLKNF